MTTAADEYWFDAMGITMKLSVVIITKNEQEDLPRALKSVAFADEIVVVDSGSTDKTIEIALAHGARVFNVDWLGYGPQKNFAVNKASGDWILSLDADEWLDLATQKKMTDLLNGLVSTHVAGFSFARRSKFIDRFIHWGDWRSDRVVRLFRRGDARFSDDLVHERLLVDGEVEDSDVVISHHPFKTLNELKMKMYRYNDLAAHRLYSRGRGGSYQAMTHAFFTFIRGYLLKLGFLDGFRGLQLAYFNAMGTWIRYENAGDMKKRDKLNSETRNWLDRLLDQPSLLLTDHGILRLAYKNQYRLAGGLFRTNQPSPGMIVDMVRRYGIRTVVNLRGENTQHGWYRLEREACQRGEIAHVNTLVFSRGLLETQDLLRLKEVIEKIELPALVHCKSGADRAGFFSALYRHFRLGEPLETSCAELGIRYGHFPFGPTGVLDHFFRTYLRDRQPRQSFESWITSGYEKRRVESDFRPTALGRWITDWLLRRE
jgi:glycosyltransferase involved in cell wall biosynthesis/protein tyrosine/serine phosphatase